MSNNNNKHPLNITPSLPVATQGLSKEDLDRLVQELEVCAERGENRGKQPLPSICKVSRILREPSKSPFDPQLVSIGLVHREDPKLQEFEWLKECYLDDLLSRCEDSPEKTLEAFLLEVNTLIPQIRESYAAVIENYSVVELSRMMVMDGCFILEFCFKHEDEDSDFPNNMQDVRIAIDLMLLENQVPFSVLQALFDCSIGEVYSSTLSSVLDKHLAPYIQLFHSDLLPEKIPTTDVESDSTHDHVLGYLHKHYQPVVAESSNRIHAEASNPIPADAEASKPVDEEQAAKSSNPIHAGILWCSVNFCKKPRILLNAPGPKQLCSSFCRNFRKCTWSNCVLAPSLHDEASNPVNEERIEITAFHSTEELDRSGVNFKPHQEDEWSMTIKFQSSPFAWLPFFWKPTLLMPTLVIEDSTELILRNFIAYEQSFPQDHCYFTSYAYAMDMLIDTKEDIAKLVESKVLVHRLGSNQEAADMINKICKNVLVKKFCYAEEFKQMDEYYNRSWPKNIAWLRRVYFSNPWSTIALVAAIILFSLTVVQTIYTIRAA